MKTRTRRVRAGDGCAVGVRRDRTHRRVHPPAAGGGHEHGNPRPTITIGPRPTISIPRPTVGPRPTVTIGPRPTISIPRPTDLGPGRP